jgi:Spy/CpxP family protein refolding chaperone
MKRAAVFTAIVLVLVVAGVTVAQQPAPQPGMPGQQHPMPMQGGMCSMMSGGGMMGGMMGAQQAESPRMVQMRGEMMKAMGEVMVKYGKMMEGAGK